MTVTPTSLDGRPQKVQRGAGNSLPQRRTACHG